ncbi:MAG: DMT family transporter [Rhodobacteraceae bacterium]|nr:DMT family transporter [Paracoccaceae bacterium]
MTSFYDSVMTSLFFACLAGIVLPLVIGWGSFAPINEAHAWNFVRLCLFNMIGQTCIVFAFAWAPATILQPLNYVQIVWAAVIGFLVFGDVLASTTWIVGAMIVVAGIMQLRASRKYGAQGQDPLVCYDGS